MMIAHIIPKGDLALVNGTTVIVTGPEYATQRVGVSLNFFLAEWFLNKLEGIPYRRDILIKNPNPDTVRSVFRRAILKTPGIVAVPVLEYVPDFNARRASVSFEAVYQDGAVIADSLELII